MGGKYRITAVGLLLSAPLACRGAAPPPPSASRNDAPASATTTGPSLPTAEASPPAIVIYDPKRKARDLAVKMLVGPHKLARTESKRILDSVFGGKYLSDDRQCKGVADSLRGGSPEQILAAARDAGDFVPWVFEVADGSFTERGGHERLYLLTVGECGASHADNFGSEMLAVFQGDAVVARSVIYGGSSILGVFDLDGDGQSEFVLTDGFTNQGNTVEAARLARFDHGKLVDVKHFGQVMDDSCASGFPGSKLTYSVIRALVRPGKPPEFNVEPKNEPCP